MRKAVVVILLLLVIGMAGFIGYGYIANGNLPFLEPKVESIEVKQEFQTVYQQNQQLNVDGGIITVTYKNKTQKDVEITKEMVSGFSTQNVGERNLVITYKDKTCNLSYKTTGVKPTGNHLYYTTRVVGYTTYSYFVYNNSTLTMYTYTVEANSTTAQQEWNNWKNNEEYVHSISDVSLSVHTLTLGDDCYYRLYSNVTGVNTCIKITSLDIIETENIETGEVVPTIAFTRYIPQN